MKYDGKVVCRAYHPICARCGCSLHAARCLKCALTSCRHVAEPMPAGPTQRVPMVCVADLLAMAVMWIAAGFIGGALPWWCR